MPENPVNPVLGKHREMDQEFKTNQDAGQVWGQARIHETFRVRKKKDMNFINFKVKINYVACLSSRFS